MQQQQIDLLPLILMHIQTLPLTWHRCSQRHKHHSRHRVLQSYRAAEVWRQIAGDRRQDADKRYGDDEAGPAVPVLRGRDKGEQDLPEHGEEVHDVVEAGRQALLAALLLIIISFGCRRWFKSWGKRQNREKAEWLKGEWKRWTEETVWTQKKVFARSQRKEAEWSWLNFRGQFFCKNSSFCRNIKAVRLKKLCNIWGNTLFGILAEESCQFGSSRISCQVFESLASLF